jgi:hypothetical protein
VNARASGSLLRGSTVYLSGPMDFVMSRPDERNFGWRSRISDVLEAWDVRIFDPWFKPSVRNLERDYGLEDETSAAARAAWDFTPGKKGARIRSQLASGFWPVMHIDLRMVDLSDFVIATCPTNLYSVGTPHEIVLARQQRKPVLLVSPPVRYLRWHELEQRLAGDDDLKALLAEVKTEVVVRENEDGVPSQWYMSLVDSESFFDGFGWASYRSAFGWPENYLDDREADPHVPVRPLLPFLDDLRDGVVPQRWRRDGGDFVTNDDWLLLEARAKEREEPTPPRG